MKLALHAYMVGSSWTSPMWQHLVLRCPARGDDRFLATREHLPVRPGWDCWACARPWPCEPAQHQLAAAYGMPDLADFMGERFVEAARDMPALEVDEIATRFVAWAWYPQH